MMVGETMMSWSSMKVGVVNTDTYTHTHTTEPRDQRLARPPHLTVDKCLGSVSSYSWHMSVYNLDSEITLATGHFLSILSK